MPIILMESQEDINKPTDMVRSAMMPSSSRVIQVYMCILTYSYLNQVHQAIWIDSVSGAFRHESISVAVARQRPKAAPKATAIPLRFLCMTAILAEDDVARSNTVCFCAFNLHLSLLFFFRHFHL